MASVHVHKEVLSTPRAHQLPLGSWLSDCTSHIIQRPLPQLLLARDCALAVAVCKSADQNKEVVFHHVASVLAHCYHQPEALSSLMNSLEDKYACPHPPWEFYLYSQSMYESMCSLCSISDVYLFFVVKALPGEMITHRYTPSTTLFFDMLINFCHLFLHN